MAEMVTQADQTTTKSKMPVDDARRGRWTIPPIPPPPWWLFSEVLPLLFLVILCLGMTREIDLLKEMNAKLSHVEEIARQTEEGSTVETPSRRGRNRKRASVDGVREDVGTSRRGDEPRRSKTERGK